MANRRYCDGDNIYSVDMMIAYVNICKPPIYKVKVRDLDYVLNEKYWWDDETDHSPMEVIDNPSKYKEDWKMIKKANMKYPIMMNNEWVVDGLHRLSKAWITKKKYIKTYKFSDDMMKNFLINEKGDWKAVKKLETFDVLKLFYERFTY